MNQASADAVDFELTEEDLVVFGLASIKASPAIARRNRLVRWSTLTIVASLGGLLLLVEDRERWVGVFWLGLAIPACLVALRIASTRIPGLLHRQIRAGKAHLLLGPRRLEIQAEGLRVTHRHGEMKLSWAAVEKLELTPEHLALRIPVGQAVVVPRRAFTAPDHERAVRLRIEELSEARFQEMRAV
jgi:hypothetical protein